MEKKAIIQAIIDALIKDMQMYESAARFAHAEATDEQSKAEHKYDTRGLEASYLARGQSRQVAETELAIKEYQKLPLKNFEPAVPIDLGALIELEAAKKERLYYFLGPKAGGTEINFEGKDILVITPQSPLGQQLIGKKKGEKLRMEIAGSRDDYKVLNVT